MKSLVNSLLLFALVFVSCSSPNNTTVVNNATVVNDSMGPTITRFSPDTIWTLKLLTVYGSHFGYDPADVNVTIGGVQAGVDSTIDTLLTITVPDSAQTGLIRVATLNGKFTSAKPIIVEHTFNPHNINGDRVPEGASFSIPGAGLENYNGFIVLRVGGLALPIDSLFDNRIVSHVISDATSGEVIISDALETYDCGYLRITRPTVWNTLSEIWDNISVRETHHRTGFIKGPTVLVDSSWTDTVTFSRQNDVTISGISFITGGKWLEYDLQSPGFYYSNLRLAWDTLLQSANISFTLPAGVSPPSRTLLLDTSWYPTAESVTFPLNLPVDRDIEFTFPNGMSYQITEDSSDEAGLVNWQEITSASVLSGSFDLIFKR